MMSDASLLWALIAARAAALAPAPLKTTVVVDVDDTVKSSGNVRLAGIPLGGIDGQYDRGDFYPGMFDFAYELGAPEPVAVLTARAEEFKFALELKESDKVVAAFRDCGRRNGAAGWGVGLDRVLYGSVHEWVFQDFKGWAGEIMLARHPDLCAAVLLHCVGTDAAPLGAVPTVRRERPPVRFFRTYVMAAFHALDLGLMGEEGFDRVVEAALRDVGDADDGREGARRRGRRGREAARAATPYP
ncbi:hypothetical protein JL720_3023 [Aureococcus anophagefferens]|nr:hypothetical protein JL720_3023 [Aureococcus anophagefferens]